MDDQINRRIYELRNSKYQDKPYRKEIAADIYREFGVKLTPTAVKKRLQRLTNKLKNGDAFDSQFFVDGNTATASYSGEEIKTLEDLLSECGVKADEWETTHFSVKKWDAQAKGGRRIPMFSVSATLKRINPEPAWPIVQPVVIDADLSLKHKEETDGLETCVILADAHIGFMKRNNKLIELHDSRALDVAIGIIRDVKPDIVVIAGDWLDLADLTDRFVRTPDMSMLTQEAIKAGASWLAKLRNAAPHSRIVYIEGNHDKRLRTSLAINTSWAYELKPADDMEGPPLMSIQRLLGLERMDIEYMDGYPNNYIFLNENLMVEHGETVRSGSGDTSKAILRDARISTYVAHIHRLEAATKTVFSSRGVICYKVMSGGCLCHLDGRVPAARSRNNWQQGIGVVQFERGNGLFADVLVSINDGSAIYNGKVYRSCSDKTDLGQSWVFPG
jgi:hypothetical protein